MRVYILDVRRRKSSVLQRALHHAHHSAPVFGGRSDVIRVARHPISGHLGVDLRAACDGAFAFFEDDDARPFAHDEAVALEIPRTRGVLRIVVPRRQRAHRRETSHSERRDHRFAAAGEHHVGVVVANHATGIADGMRAGRACSRRRGVWSSRVESNRHLSRREVDDQSRNEKWRDARRTAFEHLLVHLFDERKSANARADDHADAIGIFLGRVDAGIIDRHLRRGDGVVNERVGLLDLFLLDPLLRLEAAHLAGDLTRKRAGIELRDPVDARSSFDEPLPCRIVADAQRGDHADAGDDYASFQLHSFRDGMRHEV